MRAHLLERVGERGKSRGCQFASYSHHNELQVATQIHKYTNTQMHKYTNTQIHKYTNTQIHKYTNTLKVVAVHHYQ